MITLLESLRESYLFVITALESLADTLMWELATSRLLYKYMKRKKQVGDVAVVGQAFMSSKKKRSERPVKKIARATTAAKCAIESQSVPRGSKTTMATLDTNYLSVRMLCEMRTPSSICSWSKRSKTNLDQPQRN